MVDVPVQGLRQPIDELRHAAKSPPKGLQDSLTCRWSEVRLLPAKRACSPGGFLDFPECFGMCSTPVQPLAAGYLNIALYLRCISSGVTFSISCPINQVWPYGSRMRQLRSP